MTVLVEDVDGGGMVCVCVRVERRTGLCWKTKNSVAFVVKPVHFWLCQRPGSESSRTNIYTNTEDIRHLLSPPMLSWEGVLSWAFWALGSAEGLLGGVMVDIGWASLEVSGFPSGRKVFCGDVSIGGSELAGSRGELVLDVELDWKVVVVVVVVWGFDGSAVVVCGTWVDECVLGRAGWFDGVVESGSGGAARCDVFASDVVVSVCAGVA